jgi:GMP synthase (glutamine-hydrolysing)
LQLVGAEPIGLGDLRIVILKAGSTVAEIAERRGDFERWIRDRTGDAFRGEWATCDVRGESALPSARDADAFVVTGSSSSVTERAPWMLRTEELLRDVVAAGTPLLGICFGHQMLAQALGGEVAKNPRGREIGTVRVARLGDDPLFAGLPDAFDVNATHVDTVVKPPPGAEVLATTALDAVAAFRVGASVRAVQFHPEFDADVMRGYLRARANLVREEGGDPEALVACVQDGAPGRDILRNFARWVAARAGVAAASLVVAGSLGCDKCGGGGTTSKEADPAAVEQAKTLVAEIDKARREAMVSARGTVRPSTAGAPCPVTFDPIFSRDEATPDPLRGGDKTKKAWGGYDVPRYDPKADDLLGGFADELCAIEGVGIEYAEESAVKPGPLAFSLREALRGTPSEWQVKDILDGTRHPVDYELVIDAEVPPKLVSDKEFEPGFLKGRFYAWDNQKRTIVCSASVLVASSDALLVEYNGPAGTEEAGVDNQAKSGLVSDLREQAFAQVKKKLVAVEAGAATEASASSGAASDAGPKDAGRDGARR